ncbi:MAG: hypothetical protein IJE40_07265 [Clostridia bacterium]|nr:hypothetical protein [Clostridia bacterium]
MKRIISLLIIAVMFLTVSCSENEISLIPFINSSADGALDCEGKVFSFASSWYSEWYAFSDDELPTASVEAMMERFHSIKDEFNAEFEMLEIQMEDLPMLLITGESLPEIIDMEADVAYDLYKSNALISLNQLGSVDNNDIKWGEPNFIQYGKFEGEQYGFYPWHWEFIPQFTGTVLFNGELISSFGGINPYEIKENGLWNWDTFEDELKKYTVFENEIQHYGAVIDSYAKTAKAAIFSNGAQIIDGNEESGYNFGVNSTSALEALEWLKGIDSQKLLLDKDFLSFSIEKLAPFWIGESYYGTVFNPNDEHNKNFAPSALNDYGFITFPVGPEGTDSDVGSYVYASRRLNYISQISDIEPDNIGTIIDYIFEPIDGKDVAWQDLAKDMIFTETNNDYCLENFIYILENMEYDYSVQMGESVLTQLEDALENIVTGRRSIAEALGTVESAVMAEIDK